VLSLVGSFTIDLEPAIREMVQDLEYNPEDAETLGSLLEFIDL
jgi:hypothetical protein